MLGQLAPYQEKLTSMQRLITEMMDAKGINAWARLNFEYCETAVYMVMKHRDSTRLDELNAIADEYRNGVSDRGLLTSTATVITWPGFPPRLRKGWQSDGSLEKLRAERGVFPVIGLGDSLSDHRFMKTVQLVWHPASESVCRCHFTANFWRKLNAAT